MTKGFNTIKNIVENFVFNENYQNWIHTFGYLNFGYLSKNKEICHSTEFYQYFKAVRSKHWKISVRRKYKFKTKLEK